MKSQTLLDRGGWGKKPTDERPPAWDAYIPQGSDPTGSVGDPVESEAKWQKHVVVLLWVALGVVLVLGSALLYAKGHGLFESVPAHGTPLPHLWPEGS
jgi:hypothetical protein